jgi:MFS family permease
MQNTENLQLPQTPPLKDAFSTTLFAFLLGLLAVSVIRLGTSYKAIELEASYFQIGLVAGGFGILAVFVAVPIGRAVDRTGERAFFLAGAALIVVSAVVALTASSITGLVVSQAILGLGQAGLALSTQTLAALAGSPLIADRRFAGVAMMQSLSQLIGPVLGGATIGLMASAMLGGSGLAYAIAGASGLVALAIGWRHVHSSSGRAPAATRERTSLIRILRGEGVTGALIASVSVLVSIDILVAYLPVLGEERGIPPSFVGVLLAVRAGAGLLARPATTPAIRRFGRRSVLVGTLLVLAIAIALIPVTTSSIALLAALAVVGFGINLGAPITASWMAGSVADDDKGAALALRMSANRGAQIAVPAVLGALASGAGTGALFFATGVCLALTSQLVRRSLSKPQSREF